MCSLLIYLSYRIPQCSQNEVSINILKMKLKLTLFNIIYIYIYIYKDIYIYIYLCWEGMFSCFKWNLLLIILKKFAKTSNELHFQPILKIMPSNHLQLSFTDMIESKFSFNLSLIVTYK